MTALPSSRAKFVTVTPTLGDVRIIAWWSPTASTSFVAAGSTVIAA